MKTILLTMAAWALTVAVSYGQGNAMLKGSAEWDAAWRKQQQGMHDYKQQQEQGIESGRSLFGSDERWRKGEFAGTLYSKVPTDFKIGDWGYTSDLFQLLNKVSNTECLVLPKYKGSEVMLIRGLDMSKVTDGVEFVLQHPVVIQGTYNYVSVSGSKKTVLVLECGKKFADFITKEAEIRRKNAEDRKQEEAKRQAKIEEAKWHTWTSADDKYTVEAKFIKVMGETVYLEKRGGTIIKLQKDKLSDKDLKWIKNQGWKTSSK